MKIKSLVLASSMLLASTAFAATQATPVKSIQFILNNKTDAAISGFSVFPDITNLTPTTLPTSTLPTGTTRVVFNVVKMGQDAGVSLGYDVNVEAGVMPSDDNSSEYNCQSYDPRYRTQCVASVNPEGVYTVTTDILPTITK